MSWTPIFAFTVLLFIMAFGDMISVSTKGKFPSLVVTILVFCVFGGVLHILPSDLVDTSGLGNILTTYGMLLVFVNIGASLRLRQFVDEWKTVVVSCAAVLGVTIMGLTIGRLCFGKVYSFSSIATIAGGLPATLITSQAAEANGRMDISAFVTTILCVQQILAIPIACFCLNKETSNYVKTDAFLNYSAKQDTNTFSTKFFPALPAKYQTNSVILFRYAFLAALASLISTVTSVNSTVCALILGFLAAETGLVEKDGLRKAGAEGLILLGCLASVMKNFLSLPLSDLLAMMLPVIGLLVFGAIAAGLFAFITGKFLKWSPYLAIATGMTMMIGYPATYVMAMDSINTFTSMGDYSQNQIDALENYLVPKMVIGGVVSVSIVSVIIATIIAPHIF